MTKPISKNCSDPCTGQRECDREAQRPVSDWSRTDLDIQAFVRLASGGTDAGFDRPITR